MARGTCLDRRGVDLPPPLAPCLAVATTGEVYARSRTLAPSPPRLAAREAGSAGTTPAIALMGYVSPEGRARILSAGFQAHVGKPVDPDEIVAVIGAVAASRSGEGRPDAREP